MGALSRPRGPQESLAGYRGGGHLTPWVGLANISRCGNRERVENVVTCIRVLVGNCGNGGGGERGKRPGGGDLERV